MSYQILLVDDDADFRSEFCTCFSDYQILEASSAHQARTLLKKSNEIDLAIVDVMLPDQSGLALLEDIRRISPHLKVIILTGQGSKDVVIDALRGRADDYMEKPIDVPSMQELLKSAFAVKIPRLSPGPPGLNSKIALVKEFMERNSEKKISLKEAAGRVYLSPKYFSRFFREKTGVGFNDYRLRIKTKKMIERLRDSDDTIYQIADRFGYQHPESLIRIFKKHVGCTPTEYRRKKLRGRLKQVKAFKEIA